MAYNHINETGAVIPDTSDLLSGVESEFKKALGEDLIVTADTPQGVLIQAETLARAAVVRNNAALANQINPDLAGGVFLDAIASLTGLSRTKASRSLVSATLTGIPGTTVPAGVRVSTAQNDVFELTSAVIIGTEGNVNGTFRSIEYGAIPAEIGSLTQIIDEVLGWETITNAAGPVLGRDEQTDFSLRVQRRNTLALQGVALPEAIVSGLYNVDGVKSLTFRENTTSDPITINSIVIAPHSVYACVYGGTDAEIARALLSKKSVGSGWTGSVEVDVLDEFSGQLYPVKFDRPVIVPIKVRTTVRSESSLIDAAQSVRESILAYASGEMTSESGFAVGQSVSTWELGGAVNRLQPRIYVQSLETSSDGGTTWGTSEIYIGINQMASIVADDIEVILG